MYKNSTGLCLTDGQVDLEKTIESDDDEEVEVLEHLELEKGMGRV
jgi:hypothetical protein